MSDLLVEKIREVQRAGCAGQEAALYLLAQFRPLIKSYSWKLRRPSAEDAEADLILHFLQILLAIDLSRDSLRRDDQLVAYIAKSMYHAYINLSKAADKNRRMIPFSDCERKIGRDEGEGRSPLSWIETKLSYEPSLETDVFWEELLQNLTKHEAKIIRYYFEFGYRTQEIAKLLSTSESAVSKAKKKALKKLEAYIIEKTEDGPHEYD